VTEEDWRKMGRSSRSGDNGFCCVLLQEWKKDRGVEGGKETRGTKTGSGITPWEIDPEEGRRGRKG